MSTFMHVEIVGADRRVWSGSASMVSARTVVGDIGILANHEPVFSILAPSVVEVTTEAGDQVFASVDEGFLSVARNRVSVLAEHSALFDTKEQAAAMVAERVGAE